MISWLQKYRDEAVECQSTVLATILNPRLRVKFFALHYPEHENCANLAIEDAFKTRLEEYEERQSTPPAENEPASNDIDEFDIFGVAKSGHYKGNSELEEYLKGKSPILKGQTPLTWWRVSIFPFFVLMSYSNVVVLLQEHHHQFPILAQVARDYLSVSATSCACERTFSAAADICTPSRGGMLPKTMTRLVGSQAWLKEGVVPDGDFAEAGRYLQAYIDSVAKKKKKVICFLIFYSFLSFFIFCLQQNLF